MLKNWCHIKNFLSKKKNNINFVNYLKQNSYGLSFFIFLVIIIFSSFSFSVDDHTPLTLAISLERDKIVSEICRSSGALLDLKDREGFTPLMR